MQLVYDESRGKMECVGGVTETDPPAILFSVVVVSEQGWRTPRCRGQWPQACVPMSCVVGRRGVCPPHVRVEREIEKELLLERGRADGLRCSHNLVA